MQRRFRLAAVERLRSAALDAAVSRLGAAQRDVVDAVAQHAALGGELASCVPPAVSTRDGVLAASWRRDQLRDELLLAAGRIEQARSELEAATAGWQSARADLRAVELLHERHRAAVAAQDARSEQRTLDDLAGTVRTGGTR
jgi:flagellar export protein FliJ